VRIWQDVRASVFWPSFRAVLPPSPGLSGQFVFINSDEAIFLFRSLRHGAGQCPAAQMVFAARQFLVARRCGHGRSHPPFRGGCACHGGALVRRRGGAGALVLANPPGRAWSATRLLPVFLIRGAAVILRAGYRQWVIALAGLCGITILLFVGDFFGIVMFVVLLALMSLLLAVQHGHSKDATPILGASRLAGSCRSPSNLGLGTVGAFADAGRGAGFIPIDNLPGHHVNSAITSGLKLISFVGVVAYFYRDLWIRRRDPDVAAGFDRTLRVLPLGAPINGAAAFLANFHLKREDIIRYSYPALVYSVLLYERQGRS